MSQIIFEGKAYAKINIHLNVLNRRHDGFHDILSLMAELELHDLLKLRSCHVSESPEIEISIETDGGLFPGIINEIDPEKNLVTIAVKNYLSRLGIGGKFCFSLSKNIPSGAGLGGGSSDAACAIDLVRQALKRKKDDSCFLSAAETGSDVPFFLYGGFALARGRGEILDPINFTCGYHVLLINNGIHVNTGSAYKALNRPIIHDKNHQNSIPENIIKTLGDIHSWKNVMYNDFEDVIFRTHPELGLLKKRLYDLGSDFAAMTGSGSTVFGIFNDHNTALSAHDFLKKENRVMLTKFRL